MSVAGRKDGLPEFSTNHQTTHWLQHWLMKYLSRQSHITCFSFLSFSQTASEKLCCVCRSDQRWPVERISLNSKNINKRRTVGEPKIWTNLIICTEAVLYILYAAGRGEKCQSTYWSAPFLNRSSCKLQGSRSSTVVAVPNIIDYKSWLTIIILIKIKH